MRIDKIRLAGLTATLIHYLKGEALAKIPIWQMISLPLNEIEKRAIKWTEESGIGKILDSESMIGGGSLPGGTLPTKVVALGGHTGKRDRSGTVIRHPVAKKPTAHYWPPFGRFTPVRSQNSPAARRRARYKSSQRIKSRCIVFVSFQSR